MKTTNSLTIAALIAIFSVTACQTNQTTSNGPSNQASAKSTPATQTANQSPKPDANAVTEQKKSDAVSTNSSSASTPTAAYKAAYAARNNKDIAALKKLISKDMFEFLEMMGEGKPNALDEGLKGLIESPQGPSDDVRNEKITGDTATLQYLDANGEWKTLDLVKEDGSWKLTLGKMTESDDNGSVKKSR